MKNDNIRVLPPIQCGVFEKTWEFTRSQWLKITNLDESMISYYDDLQKDFRKFFDLFFEWAELPYSIFNKESKTFTHIDGEKVHLKGNCCEIIRKYMDIIKKGGKAASSGYSLFSKNYKSTGAKKTKEIEEFLLKINSIKDDEIEEYRKRNININNLSIDEWREIGKQITSKDSVNNLWKNSLREKLTISDRSIGARLRKELKIECARPQNVAYCRTLYEMLRAAILSTIENVNSYIKENNEEYNKIQKELKNIRKVYEKIWLLHETVFHESEGKAVVKKDSFFRALSAIKKMDDKTPSGFLVGIMLREEYKDLLIQNEKILIAGLRLLKQSLELKKRLDKKYPFRPIQKEDYCVPLGNSYSPFEMSALSGKVNLKIKSLGNIECACSNYYHGIVVEKVIQTSNNGKQNICYEIKYKRRYNRKSTIEFSQELTGIVKELRICFQKGNYYIILAANQSENPLNLDLARYFMYADPVKSINELKNKNFADIFDRLPNQIRVGSVDLNMSNVICGAKADVYKNATSGDIKALDYGFANIVEPPTIFEVDGKRLPKLYKLRRDFNNVINSIREFKTGEIRNNFAHLGNEVDLSVPRIRFLIQKEIGKLNKRLKAIESEMRAEGYQNLAEMILLISVRDTQKSMLSSYERIHLKEGEHMPQQKSNDKSREHFRLFVLRRIAAHLARHFYDCNIVFLENLETILDKESKNNSLAMIFAGRSLVKEIANILENRGIGVVQVEKSGTSKTDPITGLIGSRSKYDKNKLYVTREGKLGFINSDLAACLNILIRGLGRSIVPYKFFVNGKKYGIEEFETEETKEKEEGGKRLKRFFKTKFGCSTVRFENNNGLLERTKKTKGLLPEYAYLLNGNFVDNSVKSAHEKAIENQVNHYQNKGIKIEEFDLSLTGNTSYRAFILD